MERIGTFSAMTVTIAHLGPSGTYAEAAAIAYRELRAARGLEPATLQDYPSIAQTLLAVAGGGAEIAVVPVENSIEGGVATTLDTLWQLDNIHIQQAIVLPISHALIGIGSDLTQIDTVYSHPQGLGQCQEWLDRHLPTAARIPQNSTAAALSDLGTQPRAVAISSLRAAELYRLPVIAHPINDRPDNRTRFLVCTTQPGTGGNQTSIAFSLSRNEPGGLVKSLDYFAQRGLNLSRIESRPTKRSLGEYLFFIDIDADADRPEMTSALTDLRASAETVKVFGSYQILDL
jgi:prephenate dehydratase